MSVTTCTFYIPTFPLHIPTSLQVHVLAESYRQEVADLQDDARGLGFRSKKPKCSSLQVKYSNRRGFALHVPLPSDARGNPISLPFPRCGQRKLPLHLALIWPYKKSKELERKACCICSLHVASISVNQYKVALQAATHD
eukprot:1156649-Pelagomonas_calceolata.AAC.4